MTGTITTNTAVMAASGNDYTKSVAYENPLRIASSAAINSADAFVINLSQLLTSLRQEKVNQKDIKNVSDYINKTIGYKASLSQMCADAKESSGSKGIDTFISSSNSIKACDDFILKLFDVEAVLGIMIKSSSAENKTDLKEKLLGIISMKKDLIKMKEDLIRIHLNSRDWPTDEIKGVKGASVAEAILTREVSDIHAYVKTIKADINALYSVIGQYGAEASTSVEIDLQYVQLLALDMNYLGGEVEKIYKKFTTVRPPIDTIDGPKGSGSSSGAKVVYDKPEYAANLITNINGKIKNLSIKLANLKFAIYTILTHKELDLSSREKYTAIFESVNSLSDYVKNNITPKLEMLEKKYKK